jgi:hypothetical protein
MCDCNGLYSIVPPICHASCITAFVNCDCGNNVHACGACGNGMMLLLCPCDTHLLCTVFVTACYFYASQHLTDWFDDLLSM